MKAKFRMSCGRMLHTKNNLYSILGIMSGKERHYLCWLVTTWYCHSLGSPECSRQQGWRWFCFIRRAKQQGWVREGCVAMQTNACRQSMAVPHHKQGREKGTTQVYPVVMLGPPMTFCENKLYVTIVQGKEIGQGVNLSFLLISCFPLVRIHLEVYQVPFHLPDWILWPVRPHPEYQIHTL